MRLRVFCPAKVNPFLSVGPPDSSGYHPIRTVFQAIGLFDELVLELATNAVVTCDWAGLPAENTLTRTLRFLSELVEIPPLRIELKKRIPAQSGLGGGASDAAGLLRAISRIAPASPTQSQLQEVARAVGKDVPFFLVGGKARGEGFGDVLTPLEDGPPRWLVIAKPSFGCDTPASYARLDVHKRDWRNFPEGDGLHNDFQSVAPEECIDMIQSLNQIGAQETLLCGSGSAVFGYFESEGRARDAAGAMRSEGAAFSEVVETLSRAESLHIERLD